jgi:hypothetical protein
VLSFSWKVDADTTDQHVAVQLGNSGALLVAHVIVLCMFPTLFEIHWTFPDINRRVNGLGMRGHHQCDRDGRDAVLKMVLSYIYKQQDYLEVGVGGNGYLRGTSTSVTAADIVRTEESV